MIVLVMLGQEVEEEAQVQVQARIKEVVVDALWHTRSRDCQRLNLVVYTLHKPTHLLLAVELHRLEDGIGKK